MTGVALPINASSGSPDYDAREFRAAMAGMKGWDGGPIAGRQGIRPMGGSAANVVTLSGSTITVGLHAGEITPGWATTTGTYSVALTVAENHSLTPADATNPRKDIVVGRVYDHDESPNGGLRQYITEYIDGTPGPTPAEDPVPQGAVKLATIDVPFSGNGSPVVTNNYAMTAAAGGIVPVRTSAERDAIVNPHDGMTVYRIDRGWLEMSIGGVWRLHRMVVASTTVQVPNPQNGQIVFDTADMDWRVYNGTTWLPLTVTAEIQQTVSQNVLHATATPITFTTEIQDSHNGHSTSVNTSRYTFPRAGVFDVGGSIVLAANNAGYRAAHYRINGAVYNGSQVTYAAVQGANTGYATKQMQITVAANDYIEVYAQHNAGSTLATVVAGVDRSTLNIKSVRT